MRVDETVGLLRADLEEVDWARYHGELRRRCEDEDAGWLTELVAALLARGEDGWRWRTSEALGALALVPGDRAVDGLLSLAEDPRLWAPISPTCHPDSTTRRLGAILGQAQPVAVLSRAAATHGDGALTSRHGLLACWLQEAVLRGRDVDAEPGLVALWRSLAERGDVLAGRGMSLSLGTFEERQPQLASRYQVLSASGWGGHHWVRRATIRGGVAEFGVTDVTDPEQARRLAAFSSSARRVSNGKVEVRALTCPCAVDPKRIDEDVVRGLPLACLGDAVSDRVSDEEPLSPAPASLEQRRVVSLACERCSAQEAFETLMAAASNGGDYNIAWSGAFGRVDAHTSFTALTGAEAGTPWDGVARRAKECSFWGLRVESTWFYGVGADLAILCQWPDRRGWALVALTDTD